MKYPTAQAVHDEDGLLQVVQFGMHYSHWVVVDAFPVKHSVQVLELLTK